MIPPTPTSTLFPYTTLFRSAARIFKRHQSRDRGERSVAAVFRNAVFIEPGLQPHHDELAVCLNLVCFCPKHRRRDRKSTRLNSSHTVISYAVFCLKKKKKKH